MFKCEDTSNAFVWNAYISRGSLMARSDAEVNILSNESDKDNRKVCGIVMPITSMGDDYPEEHWRRVRKIVQRAVERANMRPQLVWENSDIDVIQSAILKNLYENDVVICDLSGLNPNVMLETGLRLSTKRPTIVITDKIMKPPFDVATIGYIDYQRDLEYNAIEDFIERLSKKIISVLNASEKSEYKSFVEQFKFETVTPATVSVPAEEYLKEQINSLVNSVRRMELRQRGTDLQVGLRRPLESHDLEIISITANLNPEIAQMTEGMIDSLPDFELCTVSTDDERKYTFHIPMNRNSKISKRRALSILKEIIEKAEFDSLPF